MKRLEFSLRTAFKFPFARASYLGHKRGAQNGDRSAL